MKSEKCRKVDSKIFLITIPRILLINIRNLNEKNVTLTWQNPDHSVILDEPAAKFESLGLFWKWIYRF